MGGINSLNVEVYLAKWSWLQMTPKMANFFECSGVHKPFFTKITHTKKHLKLKIKKSAQNLLTLFQGSKGGCSK